MDKLIFFWVKNLNENLTDLTIFDKDFTFQFDHKTFTSSNFTKGFSQFHIPQSFITLNDSFLEKEKDHIVQYGYLQVFLNSSHVSTFQISSILCEDKIKSIKLTTVFIKEKKIQKLRFGKEYYKSMILNQKKPLRIILIKHGESQANIDHTIFTKIPLHKIGLTSKGKDQAQKLGKDLNEIIGDEKVTAYCSPFEETIQTFNEMSKGFEQKIQMKLDIRLREQEWGNIQDSTTLPNILNERREYGSFYYRFSTGESAGDALDRIDHFITTLHRRIKKGLIEKNVFIITHGLICRLFLMKWFDWPVETFHSLWNFDHCQYNILELQPNGKYLIASPLKSNNPLLLPRNNFLSKNNSFEEIECKTPLDFDLSQSIDFNFQKLKKK